jgi:hypothetical protein
MPPARRFSRRALDFEAGLPFFAINLRVFDASHICGRRAFVQMSDKLVDGMFAALGFASDLRDADVSVVPIVLLLMTYCAIRGVFDEAGSPDLFSLLRRELSGMMSD